jgi:hypothetical protein
MKKSYLGESACLHISHFGMKVFQVGNCFSLRYFDDDIAIAVISKEDNYAHIAKPTLSIAELVDITECLEFIITGSVQELVFKFKEQKPVSGSFILYRFNGEFDTGEWSKPLKYFAGSSFDLPGHGDIEWKYCPANGKP